MTDSTIDRPYVPEYFAALYDFVDTRVTKLQDGYLADQPAAVAALARLRHAITASPGANPDVWAETLQRMPQKYVGADLRLTTHERAVHAALCLYAIHQQGRDERMHARGRSLGRAASRLARENKNEAAVLRRFQALATATDLDETLQHARGLITQLRAARISLDYGMLTVDLDRLQQPSRADRVRLKWGRDYYFRADDGHGKPDDERPDDSHKSGENQ